MKKELPDHIKRCFLKDVDGFFYYWPDGRISGCYTAQVLRAIADKLDEMNKPISERFVEELLANAGNA